MSSHNLAEADKGYEAPRLTAHGSVAEVTQAFLAGIIVDNNHSQGHLIIGNTSL